MASTVSKDEKPERHPQAENADRRFVVVEQFFFERFFTQSSAATSAPLSLVGEAMDEMSRALQIPRPDDEDFALTFLGVEPQQGKVRQSFFERRTATANFADHRPVVCQMLTCLA